MDNHYDEPANPQQFLNQIKEKQRKIYFITRISAIEKAESSKVGSWSQAFLAWTMETGNENATAFYIVC